MTTSDLANKLEAFQVLLMYFFNDMGEALEEAGVKPGSNGKRARAHTELEQAVDLLGSALEKLQTAAKAEESDDEDELGDLPDEHDPLPPVERLAMSGRGGADLFDLVEELSGDVGLPEGDELDLKDAVLDPDDDMTGMGRGRRPTGPSVLDGEERPSAIPAEALCRICFLQMPAEARFCPNCGCSKEPPAKRGPAIV